MKNSWLYGKTFVITGASSGIGRGLTEKLITNHGCRVYGIGRNAKKFEDLSSTLADNKNLLTPILMDVTSESAWIDFAKKLKDEGTHIDGLINCAGVLPPFDQTIKTDTEAFKCVMNVDYFACIYAINALYPTISTSSTPAIINVGSAAALATIVGTSAYSAAKSAIKAYTEALTYELRGKVYVSNIMPGFTRTDIFRSQNSTIDDNKLFLMMSMPADKMVNKIYRGIKHKRTRMIFGKDAKMMNIFYRICPRLTMLMISKVLKSAKVKLFENVFDKQ